MKLEIQAVKFKNFLSYGNKETEINFLPGVNIVLGKDLSTGRSNGSGKSSFLETIPYALFGQTHKEVRKGQLVNWKNRKGLEVALDFKKGADEYLVSRCIKPDNLEIYKNNSLIEKPAHVRDYQNILEEIIGLNFQTFCSLIHSNINSSNRILSMGKPEKRKFIENVFGLEIYSMISEHALRKIRSTEEKLNEIEIKNLNNFSSIKDCKNRIEELHKKLKYFGTYNTELKEAQVELKELEKEFKGIDDKYTIILESIENLTIKSNNLSKIDSKVNSKHVLVNRWIKETDGKIQEAEEAKKYQKEYLDFVKENGKPAEIIKKIEIIQKELSNNKKSRELSAEKTKSCEIELTRIQTNLENDESKLNNLVNHGECPTCGQSLKSSEHNILEDIQNEINEKKSTRLVQKEKVDKAKKEGNELYIKNNELNDNYRQLEKIRDRLYSLKDKVKIEYDEKQLKKQRKRYIETAKCLESQLGKTEGKIYKTDNKISALKTEKEEIQKNINKINEKKEEIKNIKVRIKLEEQTKNEFKAIITEDQKKIKKIMEENKEFDKKKQSYQNIVDYLNVIREICKDDNIKQYAISSIMPFLNQRTNHYLSEVGYSFYTVLNRWIEAEIKGPGVKDASYGNLSGGEGRGVDISLQFSLLDIAKIQAGIWPDILIMDEVLDSSVDSEGISNLVNIIKVKQNEDKNKIFIISHREKIDGFDADNTYFIKKENGYSRISIK